MLRALSGVALALVLLVGAVGSVAAAPASQALPDQYILPGDQVFPEGIAYDRETRSFYVGSTTDGTIFRGLLTEPNTTIFLPGGQDGRTSATGMKVDTRGRLYVCGAATGLLFVYDTRSGALLAKFDTKSEPQTFINDVTITPAGDAFFTDSVSPYLYRVYTDAQGALAYERWLDFTGTPLTYGQGFNVNGIAATEDGQYLIAIQTNTGKLFRITLATKQVTPIDVGGEEFTFGDGILLTGQDLHVMRNQLALLVTVRLSADYTSGHVVSAFTSPVWHYPTTFAVAEGRVLAVNSQFDKRTNPPAPVLPFTVGSAPLPLLAGGTPPPGMPTTGQPGTAFVLWAALAVLAVLGGLVLRMRAVRA